MSKDFISTVTDQVLEDVRGLAEPAARRCYPIVWIDALVVKVRVDRVVQNRPAYLALGLNLEGKKEALGLWIGTGDGESAKFWLKILTELKSRGVADVCIVCCDGLTGLPDAVEAVYGDAWVQCCIVHLIRTSLKHVSYKDRKAIVKDLRPVYQAATEEAAAGALEAFDRTWGGRYPMIAETWRRNWERVIPFLAFPEDIRRIIYTTNSIEAVNRQLRKIIKNRGHFPTEDAALKLLWLALRNAEKKWTYPIKEWPRAYTSSRSTSPAVYPSQVDLTETMHVHKSEVTPYTEHLTLPRHLGFTAPDDLRDRLRGVHRDQLARTAAALRPNPQSDVVTHATKLAIATLGRRVLALEADGAHLDALLEQLVHRTAPTLLEVYGVGIHTAAILLVAAGDNPHRLTNEAAFAHLCGVAPLPASSGKTTRHRLNPGGNRQANHALWRIVFTRMSSDERTRKYVARRLGEGRTTKEIMRSLKRYVAREVYPHLVRD